MNTKRDQDRIISLLSKINSKILRALKYAKAGKNELAAKACEGAGLMKMRAGFMSIHFFKTLPANDPWCKKATALDREVIKNCLKLQKYYTSSLPKPKKAYKLPRQKESRQEKLARQLAKRKYT